MSSLQQRIMTQCVARMQLINGTGSYTTTVASASVRDSETNWDEAELPAISIFDGDTIVPNPEAVDKVDKVIVVQHQLFKGFVKRGTDASSVRQLIKDIYTAIATDTQWKETGTPLIMQTRMIRHAISRNKDSFEIDGCEVEIELQYFIDKFSS
jgi:hypothetical protein